MNMLSDIQMLCFVAMLRNARNSINPLRLLAILLLIACGRPADEPTKSLAGSSNGIEEPDATADSTFDLPDNYESESESWDEPGDVSPQVLDATLQIEVTESVVDTSQSNQDVECPVFVPVDEPDLGAAPLKRLRRMLFDQSKMAFRGSW